MSVLSVTTEGMALYGRLKKTTVLFSAHTLIQSCLETIAESSVTMDFTLMLQMMRVNHAKKDVKFVQIQLHVDTVMNQTRHIIIRHVILFLNALWLAMNNSSFTITTPTLQDASLNALSPTPFFLIEKTFLPRITPCADTAARTVWTVKKMM